MADESHTTEPTEAELDEMLGKPGQPIEIDPEQLAAAVALQRTEARSHTTRLTGLRHWDCGFDCLSGDGTAMTIRTSPDDDGGVGLMCHTPNRKSLFYFMADYTLARDIAKALMVAADLAEADMSGTEHAD